MQRRHFLQSSLLAAPAIIIPGATRAQEAELVIGSAATNPPFGFRDGDRYSGFDFEVFNEIAKGMNRKWRLHSMEFGALIPALQTGNIDAIVSQLFIRPARQKVIDFSDPYYKSGLMAAISMDNKTIRSSEDLVGKTIGTETGTLAVDYIKDNIKGATIAQLPSINNALLALEAGRTDAVIYDKPVLMYYAANAGKGKVKVIQPTLQGLDVGVGFKKGSPLVASANATLAAMRSDGRLKAIREKWFGPGEE